MNPNEQPGGHSGKENSLRQHAEETLKGTEGNIWVVPSAIVSHSSYTAVTIKSNSTKCVERMLTTTFIVLIITAAVVQVHSI